MEPVRYQPGEAIRWLQTGAAKNRKRAKDRGREIVRTVQTIDRRTIGRNVMNVAGAIVDIGKGAWADLLHSQAMASEFVLDEEFFEVVKPNRTKHVAYETVSRIEVKGDRMLIELESGSSILVKPYAYIVAGRVKVPVGWIRNGLEVPYEVLMDELSARCGLDVVEV